MATLAARTLLMIQRKGICTKDSKVYRLAYNAQTMPILSDY
jgi:hypothetical protein